MSNYVAGIGPSNAKLMIVGEAPGKAEDESGVPFSGPSGDLVNGMLSVAGIRREECYITNVVKYRPPDNNLKRLSEIGMKVDDFIPQLWKEIDTIKPNCILSLGDLSLQTLTGKRKITNWRGSIITTSRGTEKVVPTIHPAAMMRKSGEGGMYAWKQKVYIQLDFNRAVKQSKFKEYNPPQRILQVCKNSLDLYRFIQQYRDCQKLSIDIETMHAIPICIGLAFNKNHAISVPLLSSLGPENLLGIPMHELTELWKMLIELLASPIKKIGQNFKFDQNRLQSVGIITNNLYSDTMLKFHTLYPELPKSLAFQTSIYTEEPYYKDEGKEFNPKKDKLDKLLIYNARDAAVTFEVDECMESELDEFNLRDFFYNFVMKLHYLYNDIQSRGVKYDKDRASELRKKYNTIKSELEHALYVLIEREVNVNSPKQVFGLLFGELKIPLRKDTSEDTLVALMNNTVKDKKRQEIISLILRIRRVNKTLSTYINAEPDYDGRMRTSINIVGTETGRTSCSKLGKPDRTETVGLAFQTLTKHGDVGNEIRSMLIPDSGYIFIEPDLSQAEARVVALLSNDEKTLDMFDKEDIHKVTASWCFSTTPDRITPEQRFIGKTVRHAGNYGMMKRTLMINVATSARRAGIDLVFSEYKANQVLEIFHKYNPNIRGVFQEEVRRAIDETRVLINPFGRRREFFGIVDDGMYRDAYAQIPQSTVSDHLKMAMLRIKQRIKWLQILIESHDAFLAQIRTKDLKDIGSIFKEELERPIDFSKCTLSRGMLRIPCEIKIGYKNWEKMEKWSG